MVDREEDNQSKIRFVLGLLQKNPLLFGSTIFLVVSFVIFSTERSNKSEAPDLPVGVVRPPVSSDVKEVAADLDKIEASSKRVVEEEESSSFEDLSNVTDEELTPQDVKNFVAFYISKANHKEQVILRDIEINSDPSIKKQLRSQLLAARRFREALKKVNPEDAATWQIIDDEAISADE